MCRKAYVGQIVIADHNIRTTILGTRNLNLKKEREKKKRRTSQNYVGRLCKGDCDSAWQHRHNHSGN